MATFWIVLAAASLLVKVKLCVKVVAPVVCAYAAAARINPPAVNSPVSAVSPSAGAVAFSVTAMNRALAYKPVPVDAESPMTLL